MKVLKRKKGRKEKNRKRKYSKPMAIDRGEEEGHSNVVLCPGAWRGSWGAQCSWEFSRSPLCSGRSPTTAPRPEVTGSSQTLKLLPPCFPSNNQIGSSGKKGPSLLPLHGHVHQVRRSSRQPSPPVLLAGSSHTLPPRGQSPPAPTRQHGSEELSPR